MSNENIDERPRTVRQAARERRPLDGADAQALEGALQQVERELLERSQQFAQAVSQVRSHEAFVEAFGLRRQRWSEKAFGPRDRWPLDLEAQAKVEHIRKELDEILAQPDDGKEWVDVVLLAIDGAWRCADLDARDFWQALREKLEENEARTWPDWRDAEPGRATFHVKPREVRKASRLGGLARLALAGPLALLEVGIRALGWAVDQLDGEDRS